MGFELAVLIVTGVLSAMDLIVNVFTMCMTGSCTSSCGCCSFTHDEHEHDDQHEQPPKFTVTESVVKLFTTKS
jgi:hypothetical protein